MYGPGMLLDSFCHQGLDVGDRFDEDVEPLDLPTRSGDSFSETPVRRESADVLVMLQQQQGLLMSIVSKQNQIDKKQSEFETKLGQLETKITELSSCVQADAHSADKQRKRVYSDC